MITDRYQAAVRWSRQKKDLHSVVWHGEWWKSCSLYRPIAAHSQFLPVLVTSKSSVCVATQAEVGAPGVVVGVSVDGAKVWSEGWCLKLAAVHLCLDYWVKCYHVKSHGRDKHYNILYVDWFVHYIQWTTYFFAIFCIRREEWTKQIFPGNNVFSSCFSLVLAQLFVGFFF